MARSVTGVARSSLFNKDMSFYADICTKQMTQSSNFSFPRERLTGKRTTELLNLLKAKFTSLKLSACGEDLYTCGILQGEHGVSLGCEYLMGL